MPIRDCDSLRLGEEAVTRGLSKLTSSELLNLLKGHAATGRGLAEDARK